MERVHQSILTDQHSMLVKRINPRKSLLNAMKKVGLITARQEEKIKKRHTRSEQAKAILELLPKLGPDAFHKFCAALVADGQEDVVHNHLQIDGRPTSTDHTDPSELSDDHLSNQGAASSASSETSRKSIIYTRNSSPVRDNVAAVPLEPSSTERPQPSMRVPNQGEAPSNELTRMEQVAHNLIPNIIKDSANSSSDFWNCFRRLPRTDRLPLLGVLGGMTMLHQIVYHKRIGFLAVLFNLGVWSQLLDVRSECIQPQDNNLTALEMAQKINNPDLLKELERLNQEERSLRPLHIAARAGNEADVESLLAETPQDVNQPSMNGKTPLYWAVISGNANIVQKLVDAGGDLLCRTSEGDTLLTCAASLNHAHLVDLLVYNFGMSPEQLGPNRRSPLAVAAANGSMEAFQALIRVGAPRSGTALIAAAVSGKTHVVLQLVEHYGMNPNWQDLNGKTALLTSAMSGQMASIVTLLNKGALIDATDKRKRNILHFAVEGKSEEVLSKVIKECKERDALNSLLDAQDAFSGAENVFLIRGSDSSHGNGSSWHYIMVNRNRFHLFHVSAQGGDLDMKEFGTIKKSGLGEAPSQVVKTEIDLMHSPHQIPHDAPADLTPLMLAIMKDKHSMVDILLHEKPNFNIQDSYGLTAMHLACMKGRVDTVKALRKAGASVDVLSRDGWTPLRVARENHHEAVVNYLEGLISRREIMRFNQTVLPRAHRQLDVRSLDDVESKHENLNRYAIDVLRDLQADINEALYNLGTAPVGQEASDDPGRP